MTSRIRIIWQSLILVGMSCFVQAKEAADTIIYGGLVYDGTLSSPQQVDLVLQHGKIIAITRNAQQHYFATRNIDATGLVVAPGFIDLHSHGDPFKTPHFDNFVAMGVTTISLGQDGSSPIIDDINAYQKGLLRQKLVPNIAMFVGHGSLRNYLKIGQQQPSQAQLQSMTELLERQLAFSFGLSTGLEYLPGLYASAEELNLLAKRVGEHDRVIASHMRNEDDDALESAIDELLLQGQHARVHVSHLKSVFGKGKPRAEQIIAKLQHARDNGIRVTADVYPYTASYTGLSILFPTWAKSETDFVIALSERPEQLKQHLIKRVQSRNGPDATLLGSGRYKGLTLAQAAEQRQTDYVDILLELGPQGASAAYFVMDEALQDTLIQAPFVALSSDGSPTGYHPRGHGSFAKLIETLTIKKGLFSLTEAIYKVTGLPKQILQLSDRGLISTGLAADIVVFDPNDIREHATYLQPHQVATGFRYVIVNGNLAIDEHRLTHSGGGELLLPNPKTRERVQ